MTKLKGASRLVAEFLVIVVGVLVALGVDEWVGARDDRALERAYLDGMLNDLQQDSTDLSALISFWRRSAEASELLLSVVEERSIAEDLSLFDLIKTAGLSRSVISTAATYEDLIASGRLSLIQDTDLRLAMSDYYRAAYSGYFERLDERFRTASRELLPPRLAEEVGVCDEPGRCPEPPGFDGAATLQELGDYPDIASMLRVRIRDLIRGYELLEARLSDTVELIDQVRAATTGA